MTEKDRWRPPPDASNTASDVALDAADSNDPRDEGRCRATKDCRYEVEDRLRLLTLLPST